MLFYTALLGSPPPFWDRLVYVGLVNDLGDILSPVIYQIATRCWDIRAVDGIIGAIFKEETQKRFDTIDQGADNYKIDCEKDDCAASHVEDGEVVGGIGVELIKTRRH